MTKLSDTQRIILSAAIKRTDWNVLPLPANLKGGAAAKVITSLLDKGMIEKIDAIRRSDTIWHKDSDGRCTMLVLTEHAFAALGIGPKNAHTAPADAPAPRTAATPEAAPKVRTQRDGTKQAALIAMLRAPEGATIDEIVTATGWQAHTVRGAMAGSLKKKLGLEITSEKIEGRGRVYHIKQED